MAIQFSVVRNGDHFSATADHGQAFPVGGKARYKKVKYGLSNDSGYFGSDYARQHLFWAKDFSQAFGFWATFIEPTAICEGQSFLSLNTYDDARFTFGFAQFAAHVPGGDFVLWLRDMLGRPEAADYFPDLSLKNGHIFRGAVQLETAASTQHLMDYLNPTLGATIEDAEVLAAARLMHWTVNNAGAQALQVQRMVDIAHGLVKHADDKLKKGLNGKGGDICCVVMDILHQGRGGGTTYPQMQAALNTASPFDALIEIGATGQPDRVKHLKQIMQTARKGLQAKTWSSATANFV